MQQTERGRLKIFFSYAEGIGKTQAMLREAQALKKRGEDVVVGCISTGISDAMPELFEGLELLSSSGPMDELDLDSALKRRPQVLLLDELAHTNPRDSRHARRYQDVSELMNAGIDVLTTVNVGNIESLHDIAASITGITTWERIPDAVFDNADQVVRIDIEAKELMERLHENNSADSRFTLEQLTALREVALRRCADRLRRVTEHLHDRDSFHTDEHILACLSSAPSNAKIIRTAARMANAFNGRFTAFFVETPDFAVETEENRQRLLDNQKLAQQLGASVETAYGEDVAFLIAEFARISGITKIVLGRSAARRKHLLGKGALTEQLIAHAPDLEIHIIPDRMPDTPYHPRKRPGRAGWDILRDSFISLAILLGATLLSLMFHDLGFTDSNIIMVYILGVLLTAVTIPHQIYSLISSAASVIIFNYLFTIPRFSLTAYGTGYPVTFVVMFLTAFITGRFAGRYKEQATQAAKIAHRTKMLFDTNQMLSKAKSREEIYRATAQQLQKLLDRNVIVFEAVKGQLSEPMIFGSEGAPEASFDKQKEYAAAEWSFRNNHAAGATTDTMSDVHYLYLSLRVQERVYGVIGIEADHRHLDDSEYSILLSILGECALALENEKNAREKEAAAVLAESEQLRANLLRMISHDLRTPLTTISGNAGNLLFNEHSFDEDTRKQIYSDMYEDSMWLINLVENLLYSTRIEQGHMTLSQSAELLSDIIHEAVAHIGRIGRSGSVAVSCGPELIFVRADVKLIVQVIINIVDNALKYTPEGTPVTITARQEGGMAEVRIADEGNGIPDEKKQIIFEKFYCGDSVIADNRRSLGLGLYLCKAIVEAHGGTIRVEDNHPHGAVFCFTLPLEEVILNEQIPDSCN